MAPASRSRPSSAPTWCSWTSTSRTSPESTRPAASWPTAPDIRVLMMTMSADDDAVVAAMRAGARGYVVKGAGREELLHAIRTVATGGAVFSPTVADRLGRFFTGTGDRCRPAGVPPADRPRAGGPRPGRPRLREPPHRPHAAPVRQDRAQPRVQRAHQARGRGPLRGDRPGAGRRPRGLNRATRRPCRPPGRAGPGGRRPRARPTRWCAASTASGCRESATARDRRGTSSRRPTG